MGRFKSHRVLYLFFVLLFFGLVYPILLFYARDKDKYYSKLVKIRRWIASKSAFSVGFRFKIDQKEDINDAQQYIICANHTSNLDITAIMLAYKKEFSFIGKDELLENPVTRIFFKTIDIPVNRSSKISSFRAFKKAELLLEKGKSIAIFPEGLIDEHFPPKLGSFKIGAFKLAMDSKVPILPIIIHDAWKLCWDDGMKYGTSPGTCHISILKPVDPSTFLSAEELRDEVYDSFQNIWNPQATTCGHNS